MKLFGKKKKYTFVTLSIVLSIFLGVLVAIIWGNLKNDNKSVDVYNADDLDLENYSAEPIDAKKYLEENSEIINEIMIDEPDVQLSEFAAVEMMTMRGFSETELFTEYNAEGVRIEEKLAIASSDTMHPIYYAYYLDSNARTWMIMIISNQIYAQLLSDYEEQTVYFALSETNSMLSFDSVTRTFYDIIPYETVLRLKQVDSLDTDCLNSFEIGE